jgi:cysteine-rich repeat protein
LALWGPFAAPTVDCLRHLSQATRRCVNAALSAHRRCADAQLDGHTCDEAARDATIAAARAAAANTVDAACRGGQLTELRFANADDARNDILRACSEAETTLRMVYAPALNPIMAPALSRSDRHCIEHVGAASGKLLMARVHDHSRVFDNVAAHILAPSEKLARFATANQRLTAMRDKMTLRMGDACEGATVYDGDPGAVLGHLERRSACVLSSVYFHTSVICPVAVCGDGIVDSGELCDDGNGVDSDGCRSDCTVP